MLGIEKPSHPRHCVTRIPESVRERLGDGRETAVRVLPLRVERVIEIEHDGSE
jgi:hypothetical protein